MKYRSLKKSIKKSLVLATLIIFSFFACSKSELDINPNNNKTTQQKVFKEFWESYNKYYPLFFRKKIDWQSVFDTYNPKITKTTTNEELFNYMKEIMNSIIKDGHSNVSFGNKKAGYEKVFNKEVQEMIRKNTDNQITFVQSSISNTYISYGVLKKDANIGYIKSKQFEPQNNSDSEFNNYKKIVDEALNYLKNKKGIIIDVRTNGGGQASYAFYLAGRFFKTSSKINIARQRVKVKPGSKESDLGNWITSRYNGIPVSNVEGGSIGSCDPSEYDVTKTGSFQFLKKTAVLTSQETGSSAEFFVSAMKTQNLVKTIGDITFGIFAGSEVFTFINDKNWKTQMSVIDTEVLHKGIFKSFEGIGIPPDDKLIPTNAEINLGKDIHIDAAAKYIKN